MHVTSKTVTCKNQLTDGTRN